MAEISYFAIEETIKDILVTDPRSKFLNNQKVAYDVEEKLNNLPDKCPWCGIYLMSWDSPQDEQRIGGTTPTLTDLTIRLRMYEFGLEIRRAAQNRDLFLAKVKEVLKGKRNLNNKVLITQFGGGEYENGQTSEGFFLGVSLDLICEVRE